MTLGDGAMARKILILAAFAVASLVAPAFASSEFGYIGLFVDDQHSYWCAEGGGFYEIEMWIWCFPGYKGQMCAEFAISHPANVIQSTVTQNDDIIAIAMGTLPEGMSVCYNGCQWEWNWSLHQKLWVTNQTKTRCEIVPHPDIGVYQFANCEEGYLTEPCVRFTNLYLNYSMYDSECAVCIHPHITSVEVISPYAVTATLNFPHEYGSCISDHFEAFRVNDPTDLLLRRREYTDDYQTFSIFFENPMQLDSTYVLRGECLCGCCS